MKSIATAVALVAALGIGATALADSQAVPALARTGNVPAVLVDYDDLNIYGRIYVGPWDENDYRVEPDEGRYYYRDDGRYYRVPPERRYYRYEYDNDIRHYHDRHGWRYYRHDIDDDDLEEWLEDRYDVDVDVDNGKIEIDD